MNKLDYIFPMLVGVLAFGAMLQQTNIWAACMFIFISVSCISIAVHERSKK
jgi:hypothetical protein